jgi:excinuclease ABC subunit A
MNNIIIRGARQHNLKNINVDIPRNQLVVITGLSGSGKSTLAFDTLYAEGQRRYVESLSAYARQFLERLQKPDADLIEGLSPAIAIDQKSTNHNPRSTVGTVTEVYDYLRLLYARIGTAHCHQCGKTITSQSIDEMIDQLTLQPAGTRIIILAPVVRALPGSHTALIKRHRMEGFARLRINGTIVDIDAIAPLPKTQRHTIEVVVDRLVIKDGIRNRLADSLELALSLSQGSAGVDIHPPGSDDAHTLLFSEKAACPDCGISYAEFTPSSFSFNSPHGACSTCNGLGTTSTIDPDRLVPDPHLSLRQGAVAPWANRKSHAFFTFLESLTLRFGTDMETPFHALPKALIKAMLYGDGDEDDNPHPARLDQGDKPYSGLIPQLERRYRETTSDQMREEIQRYMAFRPCPACAGARLRTESRWVKINDVAIHDVTAMPIPKALSFFRALHLAGKVARIADKIVQATIQRLEFLQDVGLAYLALDRACHTLSGGENQRIRLATQIGAKLTGVLYVLDEPSIGLHPRDHYKLLQSLFHIRDMGNSVIVVEHDAETIAAADYVIDMGPGAGINGGHVVFSGSPQALCLDKDSLTGQYLSGRLKIPVPDRRRIGNGHTLTLVGARRNNLKNIRVEFPLGRMICVTGVSGSGKSSLVIDTLFKALAHHLHKGNKANEALDAIHGLAHIDKVIHIDQSPIGRTPRSNPGTYTGLFGFVRDLFSKTEESRMRGYKSGRFSFNVKGGRCETCTGDGIIKIEMHFLPDLYVPCDICAGKRYNRETLEVRYKGKNIAEVLDMTVNQALVYFKHIAAIRDKLQTLLAVGLGYIHLGQPATTLSGGEAQRVKLARELSKRNTGRTIYILDEPTTGLHADDINQLLQVLNRLVDGGNTVVVIEHNLDVIKTADYLIDLGPEGGDGGGFVVGTGTPEALAMQASSYTGDYLKKVLNI